MRHPPSGNRKVELWQYKGIAAKFLFALPNRTLALTGNIPFASNIFANVINRLKTAKYRRLSPEDCNDVKLLSYNVGPQCD